MKNPILSYELRYWLRSPLAYFLIFTVAAFAFLTMLGTGGYFDEPLENIGSASFLNSAYALCSNNFLFAKMLLFLVAIFFGLSIYRDYQNNTHHILYSYPLHKRQYLLGKYLSACIIASATALGVYVAIWIGELMLGNHNPKIAEFQLNGYLIACFLYLLPTLLIIGSFVFIVVSLTRNIYAGFITVICFVLFQWIIESTLFHSQELMAILDPFGQNAFDLTTRDWNHEIRNSSAVPFCKYVLFNKLFWGGIAMVSLYILSLKFDFHYDKIINLGNPSYKKDKSSIHHHLAGMDKVIDYRFGIIARIKCVLLLALYDLKKIVTSWLFILLSLFAITTIFFIQLKVSKTGDFNLLPSTKLLIGAPLTIYSLIIVLSTFLYSGIIVERARTTQMHLLLDVTPIENWQLICSKISAIMLMHIIQLLLFFFTAVTIQLINGYHNLELGLYFISIFILTMPILFVWNITSVFSHSLIPNGFVSMFLLACLWLGAQSLEQVGIDTNLLKYNTLPILDYSDFNGYGPQLKGFFVICKYWISVGILLIPGIILTWKRGSSNSFSERYKLVKQRMSPLVFLFIFVAVIFLVFNASSLYRAEQAQHTTSLSSQKMKTALDAHKKNWQQYDAIVQPKISDIKLELKIFPKQRRFDATGRYLLTNHSANSIDTLFIRTSFDECTEIDWNGKAHEILNDKMMRCHLYQLEKSLAPGDTVSFSFTVVNTENTLLEKNSNVLRNGTFLKQDILPRLGYQFSEIDNVIHSHGDDAHHLYHRDAHEVTLRTKISTSIDQVAIAPGDLLNTEVREGRNHFDYFTTTPQKMNFSFHSGDYYLLKDSTRDVGIEVYCRKAHRSNTASMIAGLKASLDYNSYFGEYPYKHIRIIEFPSTEESYAATLTGNNIPASELLFNINSKSMESDLPYYVMVHELTHEWFGNQMKPAVGPGAKMLTESITEYVTLCIYRKSLGEDTGNAFLETQYQRYRKGKLKEKGKETPLFQVGQDQDYIAYGKGAIALNQISKSIGEDKMKVILSLFLKEYGRKKLRYPTTSDFITLLKSQVSVSNHKLIDQWLMQVIDFDFDDISR